MPIDRITYTTRPSKDSDGGYITVYAPDGSYVSRHRDMEECSESAIAHAQASGVSGDLVYRFVPPEKHMAIRQAFIVVEQGDVTPPDPPDAPTVQSFDSTSITLAMPASAAADHESFSVYNSDGDVQLVSGVTAATALVDGLTPGTSYTFYLTDVDDSGNESGPGATVTQSTSSAAGNTARISAVIANSTNYVEPTSFTLNRPADPVTTLTSNPSTIADIQTAMGVGSTLVTIAPGTYTGNLRLGTGGASDIDVIADGVTINGDLLIGVESGSRPTRLRWTGGTVNGHFEMHKGTDFLVDNINATLDSTGLPTSEQSHNWTGGPGDGTNPNKERFALINSQVRNNNASTSVGWAIFMGAPNSGAPPNQWDSHRDWFMGNVLIDCNPSQNFRVHDFQRAIFVGIGWNPDYTAANGPRWEDAIRNVYIVDCFALGSTITDANDPAPPFVNFEVEHFIRFHTVQNAFSNWFNSGETDCVINGSKYWHQNGDGVSEVAIGDATGSGNILQPWDQLQASTVTHIANEGLSWIVGADH